MTEQARGTTIYSVAASAGVSIASVSRVLQGSTTVSDSTRQKVLEAVEQLNYVPLGAARSLAVRHHEAHGLVLPELTGPYYSELLMGFESRAAELGQSVVLTLADGKKNLAVAVRQLATRVDALAILGSAAIPSSVVTALHGNKPVVIVAGDALPGIEAIGTENVQSARHLTEHLLGHGRRHVLFVGDPDAAPDVRERHAGFMEAHAALGLEPAEPARITSRESAGAAFAESLLIEHPDVDALVCANDELALSIMDRLQRQGIDVPSDIAVVGWDDAMAARYVRPGLTTVRQPVRELGALAADRLHARLTGAPAAEGRQVLPTEVVLRTSCGCPDPATRHTTSPPERPASQHRKKDRQ